jgi:hypothetical protein
MHVHLHHRLDWMAYVCTSYGKIKREGLDGAVMGAQMSKNKKAIIHKVLWKSIYCCAHYRA